MFIHAFDVWSDFYLRSEEALRGLGVFLLRSPARRSFG